MSYIQEAFSRVCSEAKRAEGMYVCLMKTVTYYGGPEEGGWYGTDSVVVEYQWFTTEENARAAAAEVKRIAEELSSRERRRFGDQCLREMEWCEDRMVDADHLPEPDGPTEFYVCVTDELPEATRGPRSYS